MLKPLVQDPLMLY